MNEKARESNYELVTWLFWRFGGGLGCVGGFLFCGRYQSPVLAPTFIQRANIRAEGGLWGTLYKVEI